MIPEHYSLCCVSTTSLIVFPSSLFLELMNHRYSHIYIYILSTSLTRLNFHLPFLFPSVLIYLLYKHKSYIRIRLLDSVVYIRNVTISSFPHLYLHYLFWSTRIFSTIFILATFQMISCEAPSQKNFFCPRP